MWIAAVKLIETRAIPPTSTTIPQFCIHATWCHSQKIVTTHQNNNNNFGSLAICFDYRVLVVASKSDELSFYSLDDLMRQVAVTVAVLPPAIFQQELIQSQNQHASVCEKYE